MVEVLKLVSEDVRKNYYDKTLKGLDWPALTAEAEGKIRKSNNLGEMIGIVASLLNKLDDSHTAFAPPILSQRSEFGFKAKPFGNDILVYELKDDGEAKKVGIQLGDKVAAVNGYTAARDTFSKMIRYYTILSPRVEMYLAIVHDGGPEHDVRIPARLVGQRQYVDYHSTFRVLDDQRLRDEFYSEALKGYAKEYDKGVVYLKVENFYFPEHMATLVKKAESAKAVVIDLRGNPGGAGEAITTLAAYFSDQTVVGDEIFRDKKETLKVKPQSHLISGPIFILVDGATSSAAEIFARHLQLEKRALVVGDLTAGRVNASKFFLEKVGSGQVMYFGTYITVARLVMRDGAELEKSGVKPDISCVPTVNDLRAKKDPCIDMALKAATEAAMKN